MYKNMSVIYKRIALIVIVAGVTICVASLPTGTRTSNLEKWDSPNVTTKSEADAYSNLPNGGKESTEEGTTADDVESSTRAPEDRLLDGQDADQMSTTWSTGPTDTEKPSSDATTMAAGQASTETQSGSNTTNSTVALPQGGDGLNNAKELPKGRHNANDSAQVNGQDNHKPPVKKEEELEGDGQHGGKDPKQHQEKDNQISTEPPKGNKQPIHLDRSNDEDEEPLKDNGQHTDKEKGREKDNRTEHPKKKGPDIQLDRSADDESDSKEQKNNGRGQASGQCLPKSSLKTQLKNKMKGNGQNCPHEKEVVAPSKNESLSKSTSTTVVASAGVAGNMSLEEKRVIDFVRVYLWQTPLSLIRRAMYASVRFICSLLPTLNRLAEPVLEFLDAANIGYFIGRLPEMIFGGRQAIKQVIKDYVRDIALTHPYCPIPPLFVSIIRHRM